MSTTYYPPSHRSNAFNCPYCGVKAEQNWYSIYYNAIGAYTILNDFTLSRCTHCLRRTYWFEEKMIIPSNTTAPFPHVDMPETVIDDYNEARNIVNLSPRGAAALLRLSLQKLMVELGESGKDINRDIGSLVKKGLPEEIQQALDILRVIGNESVHPGELDLRDDQETALQLFELINFIVEERISRKKRISSLFSRLPEGKRKGIEDRDKSSVT
ncbi:DUF4145 domain-containing protein [Paenibacillus peoriae]|uniref:DUF4145 domain-containing protein n=1 Tax=Paenibacillus peoriae TaxID=59893 RepID=UPI003F9C4FB0